MAAATSSGALSEKEAEVYDRQIRLWGVEAQKRMRSSRVLVIGLGALGAEVAKNLVLAGINLTLHDNRVVDETALGTQFFLSADDIGRTRAAACLPRVQEMNPLVEVHVLDREVAALGDEELCAFRLAIHCGNSTAAEQVAFAERCHRLAVPVISAALYGFWGMFALDFGRHSFTKDITRPGAKPGDAPVVTPEARSIEYPSLATVVTAPANKVWPLRKDLGAPFLAWRAYYALASGLASGPAAVGSSSAAAPSPAAAEAVAPTAEQVRSYARSCLEAAGMQLGANTFSEAALAAFVGHAGIEVVPVAAVVGGQMGQEVVKLISQRDEPVQQVFLFDGMGGTGGSVFKVTA